MAATISGEVVARCRPSSLSARLAAPVVLGALMLSASCDRQADAAPLPPRPATVNVTMTDFRFELDKAVPRGRVVFRVRNEGKSRHEMDLVSLPEDLPPLDEQLRGTERRAVDAVAVLPAHAPGTTGVIAADLTRGRYALICFMSDADGEVHALKGMHSEFRVR